jgi:hypothetical protein
MTAIYENIINVITVHPDYRSLYDPTFVPGLVVFTIKYNDTNKELSVHHVSANYTFIKLQRDYARELTVLRQYYIDNDLNNESDNSIYTCARCHNIINPDENQCCNEGFHCLTLTSDGFTSDVTIKLDESHAN